MPELGDSGPDGLIGQLIGNWRVERLLGEGGMGRVYLCEHTTLAGKRAAAKLLLPEVSRHTAVVERFHAEARAASAVEHPNIIEILDAGRLPCAEAVPYIVMRYVEGLGSLEDYCLTHGVLEVAEVCEILVQACAALSAAHARGIVHRDMKPANLLLSERPESQLFVTVVDFGIAKLFDPALKAGLQTKTNTVIGTPGYMAPEQSRAAGVDARADIYSLGVIGYRLLLGRLPFEGEGFGDILVQQITTDPPDLGRLRPDVPEAFAAALCAALSVDPGQRPQSAPELAHQLAAATPGGVAILERVARSILPMTIPGATGNANAGAATVVAPSVAAAAAPRPPPLPTTPMAAEVARAVLSTAGPSQSRWWRALVGLLAAAAIVTVAATRLGGRDEPVARSRGPIDSGAARDTAGPGPADAGVPVDAPAVRVDPADRGGDAGSELVPAPRNDHHGSRPPKPAAGNGTVSVQVTPWATVSIDGTKVGESPASKSLPAGRHVVVIANEDLGRQETIHIKVLPDKTVSIKRSW